VPTRSSDYGQTLAIKNLLQLYSAQLQTKKLAQQVIDQLQLDIPVEKLLSEVNVSANEANFILQVEAKDPVQENAPRIVQALAESFVRQHQQENLQMDQQDRIIVNILDNATPPILFSPQTKINALAGGILGALVGAFTVFVLEYLQSAFIRNADDVEKFLGLTVLGSIPTMNGQHAAAEGQAHARRWFWQRA
jgi:capsular polysaccharide biosynthesis protein